MLRTASSERSSGTGRPSRAISSRLFTACTCQPWSSVELPQSKGAHRILNIHRNVPGVLRDINKIVSDCDANIRAQLLSTDTEIGYLIMDLDSDVSQDVRKAIADLPTNIRTRILF